MKKKLLAAFLCVAMTATLFAGCGGDDNAANSNTTDDVADTSASDVVDDVADAAGDAAGPSGPLPALLSSWSQHQGCTEASTALSAA